MASGPGSYFDKFIARTLPMTAGERAVALEDDDEVRECTTVGRSSPVSVSLTLAFVVNGCGCVVAASD